jgi:hypothetical protein
MLVLSLSAQHEMFLGMAGTQWAKHALATYYVTGKESP